MADIGKLLSIYDFSAKLVENNGRKSEEKMSKTKRKSLEKKLSQLKKLKVQTESAKKVVAAVKEEEKSKKDVMAMAFAVGTQESSITESSTPSEEHGTASAAKRRTKVKA